MKDNLDYIEFVYPDKASLESFRILFEKLQEFLSDDRKEDYEEPDWDQYLTERAREYFSRTFNYGSEEGRVYLKLWNLTAQEVRVNSPRLINPGPPAYIAVLMDICNGSGFVQELVALEDMEVSKARVYIAFRNYPFEGIQGMWELMRAFGFEVRFDSFFGGMPPLSLWTLSEWDYQLAKKLVKQKKGLQE